MTIAEIHGKLSPYESMEDLLTSDVFGTFKYLHPNEGLVPFLKRAICFSDEKSTPDFLENIELAEYFFWPISLDYREPDLIIILIRKDGSRLALNIECKFYSGKHNIEGEEAIEPELSKLAGDQLVDQHLQLNSNNYSGKLGRSLERIEEKYLFYVTKHFIPPVEDILETVEKFRGTLSESSKFYWVSWREIISLDQGEIRDSFRREMIEDLGFLMKRKRLIPLTVFIESFKFARRSRYFWKAQRRFWQWELKRMKVYIDSREFFWNRRKV